MTVWKGNFWQFEKGNFWQFEMVNFDSLEREKFDSLKRKILTVLKENFWQSEKVNFDSLEKKTLTVQKGKLWQFKKVNFDSFKRKFWQFKKENFVSLEITGLITENYSTKFHWKPTKLAIQKFPGIFQHKKQKSPKKAPRKIKTFFFIKKHNENCLIIHRDYHEANSSLN